MLGYIFVLVIELLTVCNGRIWSGRPLYVIERFALPDITKSAQFPLKGAGAGVPFKITPLVSLLNTKPSESAALLAKSEDPKIGVTEPLPRLVKAIPTEHKVKIKSLHKPCHKTGCSKGSQCVYERVWMCPTYIPDLNCYCRPGCAVGNTFIPMGKALTIDDCGNRCACQDQSGEAVCTKLECVKMSDKKEAKMDSLLKYLKKLVKINLKNEEKSTTPKPLKTSASGNALQRKSTSNIINMSRRIDLNTETRFPYSPHRPFYVRTL
ncbi:uncharacterized protein LOC143046928 [Mytilus galloprovincialis]|uniref:uncharacterized protein LOC143046928 n=1 Tax=Mytilus galloprovincialis TaxID=29158 RepID=UPI003F7B9707